MTIISVAGIVETPVVRELRRESARRWMSAAKKISSLDFAAAQLLPRSNGSCQRSTDDPV
jgi:hypothetical protein